MTERKANKKAKNILFNKNINIHYKARNSEEVYRVLTCERTDGKWNVTLLEVKNSNKKITVDIETFIKNFKKDKL